jgi:hypothetical protein
MGTSISFSGQWKTRLTTYAWTTSQQQSTPETTMSAARGGAMGIELVTCVVLSASGQGLTLLQLPAHHRTTEIRIPRPRDRVLRWLILAQRYMAH